MSFLAALRVQQSQVQSQAPSQTEQPLKLFYQLSLEHNTLPTTAQQRPILQLQLKVGLRPNSPEAKPYSPQTSHLTLPPPFIHDTDKAVLRYLLSTPLSHGWPVIDTEFIHALLNTERVIFQPLNGSPQKVGLSATHQNILFWQSLSNGQQQLAAQSSAKQSLFTTGDALAAVSLIAHNTTELTLVIHTFCINNQALSPAQVALLQQALTPHNYTLSPADIPDFLMRYQQPFSALNIPLPTAVPSQPLTAQVRGAVRCTQHQGLDTLALEFVYITEHYCTWFNADTTEQRHSIIFNDVLYHINRNLALEAPFSARFKKAIKPFTYNKTTNTYSQTQDTLWQTFFIHEKLKLEKEGFFFRINHNFTKHFIQADHFLSELKQKSDGSIQVDLFLELANTQKDKPTKINLLTLLDQIHQYNLGLQHGDITLVLEDGRLLLMPAAHVTKLTEEFGDVMFAGRTNLTFNPNQASRVAQLAASLPKHSTWQGDTQILEHSQLLQQAPKVIQQADCRVNAALRPYQWLGVNWIQHLKECGVNGLLADDMGLGKTIQTISHLSLERAKNPQAQPALVVVPTSLLHNWLNECHKFAPHLKVLIYHGNQRRAKLSKSIEANNTPHIILTSYQLIINDSDYFESALFSWLVLDEAQNIKNPRTKIHIAIKNVQAEHKLCLSGTPVENNLQELWALMNFLMPLCLGSLNDFKFHFQKPIEQEGNHKKLAQLLKRIEPFILRRTKSIVTKDLPEKTEILQTIDLGEAQYSFYESIKNDTWQALQQSLEGTENPGEQQLFVLSALLKLRQACCDPALLGEKSTPSAKRQHCIHMATELATEGRALLIFSQFTSMLDILASDLKAAGISYGLLTGKTQNRQALVEQFQAGAFPVFLISLKAGGVGLNLTRADTVIHYDPWWNSAAQQQATDRAHRIGQKNAVFVYKLIAKDTIEEKIAALQARKAELGQTINQQAQQTGANFSMKLEELLSLWIDEDAAC
ncbi:DEAD/DEAH box helicase [Marinagarivorans algicola]|uniref:DEAD/DEAH box helicase n=1 Tax=Marinagarivorans algicola TaxID=1513270 RepID=UPI0006B590A1|nr:DEAD/DEAH box helicase [Marinagarivorans algicola]